MYNLPIPCLHCNEEPVVTFPITDYQIQAVKITCAYCNQSIQRKGEDNLVVEKQVIQLWNRTNKI